MYVNITTVFIKDVFVFAYFKYYVVAEYYRVKIRLALKITNIFLLVQDLFKGFEENFDTLNSKSQNCQSDF